MSSEFWAAIAGAIVGALAGGGITAILQWQTIKHETRQRNRGLAYSLLFKVRQIYRHLRGLNLHFEEALKGASAQQMALPWAILQGMTGSPADVFFSVEEIALVLELKATKTLDALLSMDEKHNATFGTFRFYGEKRDQLVDALTPDFMDGDHGLADVPLPLRPKSIGLAGIVHDMREYLSSDTGHALDVLQQLAELFEGRLEVEFSAMPKPEPAPADKLPIEGPRVR
ncbi:hypothetical protein [Phenylobacterium sp.]|uniref:hypothetical protein n=1 Tax=Phenylobacterium sp. TaxID=1871053 RepID=UPI0035614416